MFIYNFFVQHGYCPYAFEKAATDTQTKKQLLTTLIYFKVFMFQSYTTIVQSNLQYTYSMLKSIKQRKSPKSGFCKGKITHLPTSLNLLRNKHQSPGLRVY